MNPEWEELLDEVDTFLDKYEDVRDGPEGRPIPNMAMRLRSELRRLRAQAPELELTQAKEKA